MAKVSSKMKMSKKKAKKSADDSAVKKVEVVYDEEEDEEVGLHENITSEEEEEGEEDERKRQKLLEAISALGGKRKRTLGERSEAAVHVSEFSVHAEGEGDKVDLSDLIGTLDQTPQVSAKTKKQLKTLQQGSRAVDSPLSKQETLRIQRGVAFHKAAKEVTRWKGVIKQNQRAEQLVFPLNQEPSGPRPMERVVTGWKARTPLEEQIFALLNANKQPVHDPVLTPQEEASLKAMSLDEAKIRRAELQKARALQSYYEAKARRERKIKSKKYHKVQNKAKRKDLVKQFDDMVKSDPAAALEELNRIEVARMQERMSLKHQNSGKWAKSKAIMAKYDEGARKAMQQQLEVNKELTQKLVTALNDHDDDEDEEEEEGGDPEVLPDFVNDAEQVVDSSNPWMRGKLSEDPAEKEASEIVDLTAEEEPAAEEEEEEEEEVRETEEEALLREFDSRRKRRQAQETDSIPVISLVDDDEEEEEEEQSKAAAEEEEEEQSKAAAEEEEEEQSKAAAEEEEEEQSKAVAEEEEEEQSKAAAEEEEEEQSKAAAEEEEDDEEDEEDLSEFTNLYKELADSRREEQEEQEVQEEAAAAADAAASSAQLEETLLRIRTLEDTEELLVQEESDADEAPPAAEAPPPASQHAGKNKKRKRGIELKRVLTKETKDIHVPLARTVEDAEDSDDDQEQRGLIREAFAGDDVVSDFLKDKRKQEDAGKPAVVDLTLPGWGEWGGTGLKPSRRKRQKFRVKVAPPPTRKDASLPSVIISEKRNRAITLHQVNTLPFPFETHGQFESTIRTPLGRTWNTERTVKKMSKPKVVTQMGAIIEPMAREELMKDRRQASAVNRNSVNSGKRKR